MSHWNFRWDLKSNLTLLLEQCGTQVFLDEAEDARGRHTIDHMASFAPLHLLVCCSCDLYDDILH